MKRFYLAITLCIAVMLLCGCSSPESKYYKEAEELYKNGEYEDAIWEYTMAKGYKDSVEKIDSCNYNIAMQYYNEGNYLSAEWYFDDCAGYKDASQMALNCEVQDFIVEFNEETDKLLLPKLSDLTVVSVERQLVVDAHLPKIVFESKIFENSSLEQKIDYYRAVKESFPYGVTKMVSFKTSDGLYTANSALDGSSLEVYFNGELIHEESFTKPVKNSETSGKCIVCNGTGTMKGYSTNYSWEEPYYWDCSSCGGDGWD